ncbi:MAG TPA: nuclear transport factor 2 family protein [Fimbriimonadaceae bacterium]|nr:nuclear transport factor 2 family protein [Fimbriimonadaceae bacterium]
MAVRTEDFDSDQKEIYEHIVGLFDSFIKKDESAVKAGHTNDWKGFQIPSKSLVRGIDDYMVKAREVMQKITAYDYEFLDMSIDVYGDVAIVLYLARDFLRDAQGNESTILIRSLDVYRRESHGWNQCASNINTMSDD